MLRGGERGAGTMLSAGVCLTLLVVTWMASVLVSWVGQASAAQDAADLASLAAASAMAKGEPPCAAAQDAARRNDATVVDCHVTGEPRSFVVEVRTRVDLEPRLPGAPSAVVRVASAGTVQ